MSKMVLFDCDGVLINTEELGYEIMKEMLKDDGVNLSRTQYVKMLSGITYEEFHKRLRDSFPHIRGDFREELDARMQLSFKKNMKAIDGIKELLQNLKANNIPFAVCSNSGAENLIRKLKDVGLYDDFVPYIYSRHHVENAKPAPDMYELAAANRGMKPEDCLVVEDSITGTIAGVDAKMTVIGFVGEVHRELDEAEMLKEKGAKMIAFSAEEIWEHVVDFAGLRPRFPFWGPDFQP